MKLKKRLSCWSLWAMNRKQSKPHIGKLKTSWSRKMMNRRKNIGRRWFWKLSNMRNKMKSSCLSSMSILNFWASKMTRKQLRMTNKLKSAKRNLTMVKSSEFVTKVKKFQIMRTKRLRASRRSKVSKEYRKTSRGQQQFKYPQLKTSKWGRP